jgi:hypothetical protein
MIDAPGACRMEPPRRRNEVAVGSLLCGAVLVTKAGRSPAFAPEPKGRKALRKASACRSGQAPLPHPEPRLEARLEPGTGP